MGISVLYDWLPVWYHHYFLKNADQRVLAWPMVDNTFLNVFIIVCYMIFVLKLGPSWMRHRKPFDLRRIMVPYNIALVIINFYIFIEYTKIRWFGDKDAACLPLHKSKNPQSFVLAEITWWFYLTKFIELSDTVFFVLRKKDNQLSNLHLIHHSAVPLMVWGALRYEPGGYNTFFPQANAFVHCVMYTYYALAAFGEEMQAHLWFKKYITMTQMIQFILVLTYFVTRPMVGCPVTTEASIFNISISGFFLVLFINFYWHAYLKEATPTTSPKKAERYVSNGLKSH